MSGRSIWKGFIHFGDTDVPVKLHSAVREERIRFHLLHKRDSVRLQQQMICAYEKTPVPAEAQARGFEVEEGKFIIIDPEEIEQTSPESSRIIEVHEFVKAGQIDAFFLDRAYYLEPDAYLKGYYSLIEVLEEMGVEGICSWTMRKRAYLGALRANGKVLRLNTLRHSDEVVSASALGLKEIAVVEKEVKIGTQLIEQLTAPFEPQKFEDEHQKKLQALIDKKARGEKIAILRPRRLKPTPSAKLLQALEESLKKAA